MATMGLVSGNCIQNIVVCDTVEFAKILWPGYEIITIEDMNSHLGIGWCQSGSVWIDPAVVTDTSGSI